MNDIIVKDLCKRFGAQPVLSHFSAVFPAGRVSVLMGPSGCGKTTLASILLGLITPDGGHIAGISARKAAVFQEDRLCEDFSAVSNIRLVTGRALPAAEIESCLAQLGLADSMYRPVRELSGGMRRRVAIARALLAISSWIIMDEPFKGLDAATRAEVMAAVRARTQGKTILLITHDPYEAAAFGGHIIKMEKCVYEQARNS